jgi:predicted Zn-dependent peptidase
MTQNPQVHLIPTEQFKTLSVSLKFIGPFEASTVNERALLPQILLAATKRHPNKRAMQLHFDTLYGTQIGGSVAKIGLQSVISFSASIVREDLLGRPIYEAVADLFHEILFEPKTRNGRFLKNIVQNEIQLLSDSLEAIYNDKTEYAYRQMRAKMFEGELFAHSDQGVLDTLCDVTVESLWKAYQSMIQEDAIELYVVGDGSSDAFADALAKRLPLRPVPVDAEWLDRETPPKRDVQRLVDVDDVKQTKLDIGYRTHTWYDSDNVFPMFVFNTLFGDSEQSVLFQTVREKAHLCYSIQSSYHHNKGFLVVSAGIEADKVDGAIAAVERERDRIANGDFTEEDLELAKRWLMEAQRRGLDSPTSLIVRHFNYKHQLKRPYDKDAFETYLNAVTKADVQAAAAMITLDTIHVLTGGTPR